MKNEKIKIMKMAKELPQTEMIFKAMKDHETEIQGYTLPKLPKRILAKKPTMALSHTNFRTTSAIAETLGEVPLIQSRDNIEIPIINVNESYTLNFGDDQLFLCGFSAPAGQKVTIVSKFVGVQNYQTLICTPNLDILYGAQNIFVDSDCLSFVSDGSVYVLAFKLLTPVTSKSMEFGLVARANINPYEPSDNFYQTTINYGSYINTVEKFDDVVDWDWFRITPDADGTYYVCVIDPSNPSAAMKVTLGAFNQSSATFSYNTLTTPIMGFHFTAKKGDVCGICIRPTDLKQTSQLIGKDYQLIVGRRGSGPCPQKITLDKLEGGTVCNYFKDLGYWRMEGAKKGGKTRYTATIEPSDFSSFSAPVLFVNEWYHENMISSNFCFPGVGTHIYEVDTLYGPGLDGSFDSGGHTHYYNVIVFGWYDFTGGNISCSQASYMSVSS